MYTVHLPAALSNRPFALPVEAAAVLWCLLTATSLQR